MAVYLFPESTLRLWCLEPDFVGVLGIFSLGVNCRSGLFSNEEFTLILEMLAFSGDDELDLGGEED